MQSQQTSQVNAQQKFIQLVNQIISGIQVGQKRGIFSMEEAHELFGYIIKMKKSIEAKKIDKEFIGLLNKLVAGIQMSQKRGTYTLEEAHALYTIIMEIKKMTQGIPQTKPKPKPVLQKKKLSTIKEEDVMEL